MHCTDFLAGGKLAFHSWDKYSSPQVLFQAVLHSFHHHDLCQSPCLPVDFQLCGPFPYLFLDLALVGPFHLRLA